MGKANSQPRIMEQRDHVAHGIRKDREPPPLAKLLKCRLQGAFDRIHKRAVTDRLGSIGHDDQNLAGQIASNYPGRRALLVEGDTDLRSVAQQWLNGVGLSIEIAANGPQAIAKACNKGFDFILMGSELPIMNGMQVCRELRGISRFEQLAIIVMMPNENEDHRVQYLQAGASDFIPTPLQLESFYSVLLKWLDQSSSTTPHRIL